MLKKNLPLLKKNLPPRIKRLLKKLFTKNDCLYKYNADKFNTIFIHIPKTGGNSICKALSFKKSNGHKPWFEYQDNNYAKFQKYFKFAIVRNPWDRLVSAFFYLKKGGMHNGDKQWAKENIEEYNTFEDFVLGWVNEKNIYSGVHFKPQSYWICDENKKIMVDFIARLETIDQDFLFISNKIGSQNKIIKKLNKSSRLNYRKYYDEKTRNIVKNAYKDDIELFGYEF